jgi:DNA-binding transcriptional LysR family regulator
MNIKLFRDALALIEARSLSRAAARRNVTQPAFSRRIRSLENWVGAPLLRRAKNNVELAPALLEAETEIRALIARAEKLRIRLTPDGREALSIVIATQHALTADVFPRVFEDLAQRRPEVGWRVRTLNREDCVALFVRRDADLLLCYEARGFPPLPFDATIQRRVIGGDTLIPVVGGVLRHKMGADRKLGQVPVLTYPEDSHFGRLLHQTGLDEAFSGGARPARKVEAAFSGLLFELVSRGAGVGWLPYTMCREGLASGDLVSLAEVYGSIPLEITLFALDTHQLAIELLRDT